MDEGEEKARQILRFEKTSNWYSKLDKIDPDPFTFTHFVTGLQNHEIQRWEGAIAFFGLSIEEELASSYGSLVPSSKPVYQRNGRPVLLKDMGFEELIKWATDNNLLPSSVADKAHQLRKARNFFDHSYAIMRLKIKNALDSGDLPDVLPAEMGVPAYIASLLGGTPSAASGVPPGLLNSEEASEKAAEIALEVLAALNP